MIRVTRFVISLRVQFNIDLSFSEMRRLYSVKLKRAYTSRKRKNKGELERVNDRNFPNSMLMRLRIRKYTRR